MRGQGLLNIVYKNLLDIVLQILHLNTTDTYIPDIYMDSVIRPLSVATDVGKPYPLGSLESHVSWGSHAALRCHGALGSHEASGSHEAQRA